MDKNEFLSNLKVNIKKINENIAIGLSVNKIAPEFFGCREDNIRKWLKQVGYTRDKTSKQFVVNKPTISNINPVTEKTTIDYKPLVASNKVEKAEIINQEVMDNNPLPKDNDEVTCYKFTGKLQEYPFSIEDIEILRAFVERNKALKTLLDDENKGEDKVHSVRCYSNIYSKFKEKCDAQNIRIQDALYIALNNYINNK